MSQRKSSTREQPIAELLDDDLPAEELERLARVDALLRVVARDPDDVRGRTGGATPPKRLRRRLRPASEDGVRPRLGLVATPRAPSRLGQQRADQQTYELKLTFAQLALVYKSLEAIKTLGALSPQDELLGDTMQVVDLAMTAAV